MKMRREAVAYGCAQTSPPGKKGGEGTQPGMPALEGGVRRRRRRGARVAWWRMEGAE